MTPVSEARVTVTRQPHPRRLVWIGRRIETPVAGASKTASSGDRSSDGADNEADEATRQWLRSF